MNYDVVLNNLSKSKFRKSFHLRKYMIQYIDDKGMDTIERHAKDLIKTKIGSAYPKNDGKQTPMRKHPVFIAMHACGCCCRGCLDRWYHIPEGRKLTDSEIDDLTKLIMIWIKREYEKQT